jgi:hypothetical protein
MHTVAITMSITRLNLTRLCLSEAHQLAPNTAQHATLKYVRKLYAGDKGSVLSCTASGGALGAAYLVAAWSFA